MQNKEEAESHLRIGNIKMLLLDEAKAFVFRVFAK